MSEQDSRFSEFASGPGWPPRFCLRRHNSTIGSSLSKTFWDLPHAIFSISLPGRQVVWRWLV